MSRASTFIITDGQLAIHPSLLEAWSTFTSEEKESLLCQILQPLRHSLILFHPNSLSALQRIFQKDPIFCDVTQIIKDLLAGKYAAVAKGCFTLFSKKKLKAPLILLADLIAKQKAGTAGIDVSGCFKQLGLDTTNLNQLDPIEQALKIHTYLEKNFSDPSAIGRIAWNKAASYLTHPNIETFNLAKKYFDQITDKEANGAFNFAYLLDQEGPGQNKEEAIDYYIIAVQLGSTRALKHLADKVEKQLIAYADIANSSCIDETIPDHAPPSLQAAHLYWAAAQAGCSSAMMALASLMIRDRDAFPSISLDFNMLGADQIPTEKKTNVSYRAAALYNCAIKLGEKEALIHFSSLVEEGAIDHAHFPIHFRDTHIENLLKKYPNLTFIPPIQQLLAHSVWGRAQLIPPSGTTIKMKTMRHTHQRKGSSYV